MDRGSLADRPSGSRREIVAAVRAVLDVAAATAEGFTSVCGTLMGRARRALPGAPGKVQSDEDQAVGNQA
jgi:hypothetical protein